MCFFFSSRRRHTRFKCDWSSDVCSSDLKVQTPKTMVTKRIKSEFNTWLSDEGHQCEGHGFLAYIRNDSASSSVIDCKHARITTSETAATARHKIARCS